MNLIYINFSLDSARPQAWYKKVVKVKIKTVGLTFFKKIGNVKFFYNIAQFYSNMMKTSCT